MPARIPPFGVPVVSLGQPDLTTALPNSTFVTACGSSHFSATSYSPTAPDYFIKNSVNQKLSGTYSVSMSLLGYDAVNQGYTVTQAPAFITGLSITSGNGIQFELSQANFPSGMGEAFAMMLWLQKGSANAQAAAFAFINPQVNFSYVMYTQPLLSVPFVPTSLLTASSSNTSTYLGSRVPYGIVFNSYTPTTGGVHLVHKATLMHVSQDDVVDYDLVTARATELRFSVLSNAPQFAANAIGGDAWQYTDTDTTYVQITNSDIYAVVNNTPGNLPISVLDPPDSNGYQNQRLYLGNLTVNNTEFTEDFLKTQPFKLDFSLQPAALDYLIEGLNVGIQFKKFPG